MARLLRAAGETVELLFVIESRVPTPASIPADRPQLMARFLGDLRGDAAPALAILSRLREVGDDACVAEAHRWSVEVGILPRELSGDAFARMFRVFERNARALLVYEPSGARARNFSMRSLSAAAAFSKWCPAFSITKRSASRRVSSTSEITS